MSKLTIEILNEKFVETGSIFQTLEFAYEFFQTDPHPINKQEREDVEKNNFEVERLMEVFIREESGLNDRVPEKHRDRVWTVAWKKAHSEGYFSIYNELIQLIEIF